MSRYHLPVDPGLESVRVLILSKMWELAEERKMLWAAADTLNQDWKLSPLIGNERAEQARFNLAETMGESCERSGRNTNCTDGREETACERTVIIKTRRLRVQGNNKTQRVSRPPWIQRLFRCRKESNPWAPTCPVTVTEATRMGGRLTAGKLSGSHIGDLYPHAVLERS